jgi:hypothetical protein
MKVLYTKLYCILTNKINLLCTAMRVSVTQHVETDRVENVIQYNRRCYDSTGCV